MTQFDPEFAVRQAVVSTAFEDHELGRAFVEQLRDVADGRMSAEDLIAGEIARAKAAATQPSQIFTLHPGGSPSLLG